MNTSERLLSLDLYLVEFVECWWFIEYTFGFSAINSVMIMVCISSLNWPGTLFIGVVLQFCWDGIWQVKMVLVLFDPFVHVVVLDLIHE